MKPRLSAALQLATETHVLLVQKIISAPQPPTFTERLRELYLIQRAGIMEVRPDEVEVPPHKKHLFECPWVDLIPQDRIFLANLYIASSDYRG